MEKLTFEQELLGVGDLPQADIYLDPVKEFLERSRFEPPAPTPVDESIEATIPYFNETLVPVARVNPANAKARFERFARQVAKVFPIDGEEYAEVLELAKTTLAQVREEILAAKV